MTPGRALLFGLLVAAAPVRAAGPTIQFTGVLTADGKTRLALTDKATDTTHWVEPGDEFKGYAIARYDAAEEAVFVKKSGQEHRLPLASPQHRPALSALSAAGTAPAAASEATQRAIRSNLRALAAAARQYQLERGTTAVSFADLVGPGKFIGELKSVAGENYSTLTFSPDVTAISVTTTDGATVAIDLSTGLAQAPKPPVPPAPPASVAPAPAPPSAASAPISAPTTAPTVASAPPPAPEALPPTGREPVSPTYQIQGGDTWQKIAHATGVAVSELQRLNPTVNGSSLPAGQTIRIK